MDVNRWMAADLAARDLAGRRERPNSAAMFFTLIVVTAVCLASYGLVLGRWRVERRRIDRDAWAMVLRAGQNLATRDFVTPQVLASLRGKLAERFPDNPQVIRAITPYRSCKDRIQTFSYKGQRADLTGRTVHFDESGPDLYLSGQTIPEPGRGFSQGNEEGLIFSPRAIAKLGLEPPPPLPFRVSVDVGVTTREVDVIGIFERNLPDHYEFLITEGFERRLMRGDPEFSYVISGPLPPRWREGAGAIAWDERDAWRDLPREIVDRLEVVELVDDRLRLQASSSFDASTGAVRTTLAESAWEKLLAELAMAMRSRTDVDSKEFVKFHADGNAEVDVEAPYDLVNVYVREAGALGPAADVCDEIINVGGQGTVNRDVIRRLESIDVRLRDSMRTVHYQQAVIVLLSAFTLLVLQIFRAIGKTSEVGMLRAMGMKRRQVVAFIILQACFLAVAGALFGITLGGGAALAVSFSTYENREESIAGVAVPWQLLASIASGTVTITMMSGFLSAWRWFVHEPARLMR